MRPARNSQRLIEQVRRAYDAEKRTVGRTLRLILKAREAGIAFKELAIPIAESSAKDAEVLDHASRVEVAFRQRVAKHRRRARVTGGHAEPLARTRRDRAPCSEKENSKMSPYRRRVIEEWYDATPPGTCLPDEPSETDGLSDAQDHDLGDAADLDE